MKQIEDLFEFYQSMMPEQRDRVYRMARIQMGFEPGPFESLFLFIKGFWKMKKKGGNKN